MKKFIKNTHNAVYPVHGSRRLRLLTTNGLFISILLVLTPNLFALKEKVKLSDKADLKKTEESVNQKKRDYFLCMSAHYEYLSGEPTKALSSFKKLLSKDGAPLNAYEGYIKLLFDLNQFQEIVKLKEEKIKDNFNENLEIQIIFALSFSNLNQAEKADKLFAKLLEKYPDDEQVAYYAIVADMRNNKLDKALAFIKKSLERPAFRSKFFIFYFLASKIYLQKGEQQNALEAINKSLECYSNFGKGWLLKALLEEQLGKVNEAIKGYKNFLSIVGRDLAAEKQLVSLLFRSNRFKEAADVLRSINSDSPSYFFDLALVEWKSGNYDEALKNINKSLDKMPDFKKAKMLKIELLLSSNQKNEALAFVQSWLKSSPHDDGAVHVLLLMKKVDIKNEQIIKVLETVLKDAQDSISILSALCDLCLEKSDYQKVVNYSQKLLALVKDDELKSKILFQIGFVYFATNQVDKVEPVLKDAMNFKPTYPSVYNLLAYFYAKNDKKLQDALQLCELALKSDPNCYYYLDTKGYVLLKLGNFKEAIEFLEKALNLSQMVTGQQDKIILEHLKYAKTLKA